MSISGQILCEDTYEGQLWILDTYAPESVQYDLRSFEKPLYVTWICNVFRARRNVLSEIPLSVACSFTSLAVTACPFASGTIG